MSAPAATILVVDDEIQSRKLLTLLLGPEGYTVLTAASGAEALALIARRAPDLVVLDIMMPDMDGYQVAGAIKADPATSNIPIIMITASAGRSARMEGLKAGAEEVLMMPVDRGELWLRVRNLLRLKALGDFFKSHSAILERDVEARTASLAASELRFRQMAENIGDVFYLRDADGGRMLYVSPAYEEIWGRSCQSLYDDPASWSAAVHPDDRAMAREKNDSGVLSGKFDFEYRIVRPDGAVRWIQTKGFPVRDESGALARIAGVAEDITVRKLAEIGVKRLNRVYAVLSQINALIVRARSRDELFREACRIAVGAGAFKLAWVGVVERGTKHLKPVAWEGAAQDYLEQMPLSLNPADQDQFGLAGLAVRDKKPVIVEDMEHDPRVLLRGEARRLGFHALAMLPLLVSDTVVGVLALYADEIGFFNEGEMKLLTELAGDIAFAIDHIEAAAKLGRTTRVNAMLSGINSAIVRTRERQELSEEVCRIAISEGGFMLARVIELDPGGKARLAANTGTDSQQYQELIDEYNADPGRAETLLARAVRSRQPAVSNDIANDPRVPKRAVLTGASFALAVLPIIVGKRVAGALTLRAREPGMFDEAELRLLVELVSNFAFAIDHIEAAAENERMTRVNAMLSGINTAIVRIRGRQGLFEEACRIAVSEGGFLLARVIELDAAGNARIAATTEAGSRRYQQVVDEYNADPAGSSSLLAKVIRDAQPAVINDVATDPRVPGRAGLTEDGTYALALLPIVVERRVAGVVTLRAREPGMFDEGELRLLLELVSNIAFAVEHMEKADKLQRLTRMNAVLSGINGAIVRIRDRRELFEEACRIAVEAGGLPFVSMSVVDEAEMRLRPAASAGDDGGFLATLHDRLSLRDDSPAGHGISARSVRQKCALVLNDVENAPEIANKQALAQRGIRSMAAFPLLVAGRAVGAFALHSAEVGFFDDEEMKLLQEVAGNIAFALEHMDKEEKVERLTRVYAVLSGINTLIVRVHNRDELFQKACEIATEQGGFRMAWIGLVDRAAQKIIPVASAGANAGFLADPRQWLSLVDDSPGPAVMAVRDKQPVVVDEVASDPRMAGRMAHLDPGVRSLVILPLLVAGEPIAVFGLHAVEAGYFDEQEMKLLRELAGDIAFAIDHIEKQERLDYLAYYDALTGLANRTLFLERTAQYIRSAARDGHQLALFLMDLERFKNINDSLGQDAGDQLLKQVAQWLARKVADVSLLARIDADHFAVVLPKVTREGSVAHLLDKAMDSFEEHPFHLGAGVFRVATKAGVALFPEDGASAETLFKNAEAALKKAKASGDRYLFYTPQMTEAVASKLTLENQLREAFDKGQFVLHYQPKVSLANGKLTGTEALIRWDDPRTGLVPPGRFIPVLEEIGMIGEVGRWALRKAVEDYLRWLDAGLPAVRIAVNVSPLQLRNRDFVAEVAQAIAVDPRAPAGLELEITENLIMEDVKHSIAALRAIRNLGVTIAIDDFGTGFSSLSYLSKLPVDTLKIDRSFVVEMTAAEGRSLVPAIIGLAHSLKLKVVAEGVETEDQQRLLRLLNCDEMQGYLFSKPVPAAVFEAKFLARPAAAATTAPAVA